MDRWNKYLDWRVWPNICSSSFGTLKRRFCLDIIKCWIWTTETNQMKFLFMIVSKYFWSFPQKKFTGLLWTFLSPLLIRPAKLFLLYLDKKKYWIWIFYPNFLNQIDYSLYDIVSYSWETNIRNIDSGKGDK